MATSQLSGVNFEVEGAEIRFFGARGTKLGSSWGINATGGNTFFEVDPSSIMPDIEGCINEDVIARNGDKIAMLLLAPRQAVVLYLEGRLTRQDLVRAIEGPDHIDIPDVDINGRNLTVRILKNPEHRVATADSEGSVL